MNLLFYIAKNGNFSDWLISTWTQGPFSHVELQFSDGICFSASKRDGGTRFKKIDVIPEHWAKINVNCNENKIRDWCQNQLGCKYDLLGVLGLALHIKYKNKKQWFCSELVGEALRVGGLIKLNKPLSPNGLWKVLVNKLL